MSYIELENVTYRYPLSDKNALENVSCKFEKGKFYGVIGENGGGKTTLCNVIRGLIPHFYKGELSGKVEVMGEKIEDWDQAELSARIGYVFQNPFTQISGIKETVFEEIAMGMENLGVDKEIIIDKVIEICQMLKIEDLMEKNPNELSGGQRQRVAFASIIAMNTELLVIDEPTSQLDPQGTQEIFEIIELLKKAGKTIILVEHKINQIAEFCDEILVMQDGKLVSCGDVKKVLTDWKLEEKGVTLPQVALLGKRLAEEGVSLEEMPITIAEAVKLIKKRMEA